ncbi:MAG: putative Ig domain-containing protein [Acidobacteriota bacterium]
MISSLQLRLQCLTAVVLMSVFATSVHAQGTPISGTAQIALTPRAATVTVGSNILADLRVNLTGVTGKAPDTSSTSAVLGAYVITVQFDSSRLQYVSATGGITPEYGGLPTTNTSQAGTGQITVSAVQNSSSSPTGLVYVAVVTFKAIAAGSASLQPSADSLSSAYQPPSSGPANIPSTSSSSSVTVNGANQPPTITTPAAQNSAEGQAVSLQVSANDPDGDPITFSATSLPQGLSIAGNGLISGTIGYSAAASSPYTVQVSASDGRGGTDTKSFSWTITNTNRPPTLTAPAAQSSTEGSTVSLQLSASDPDGDTLTSSASGLPPGLTISSSGLIGGTVAANASNSSPYSVQVTVSDGKGGSDSKSFSWTVTRANRAPVLTVPGNQTTVEGSSVSLQVSATDADGDPLTWTASGLPPGLSMNASGLIAGTVTSNASSGSPYTVTVNVMDGKGGVASGSFAWTITRSCVAPEVPGPAAPSSANSGVLYNVLWNSVAGATAYEVQESDSSSFSNPSTVTVTSNSNKFSHVVTEDTRYYYRVRALNQGCALASNFSSSVSTLVSAGSAGTAPGAVSNPSPADGALNVGIPVVLSWSAASGATSYDVYFGPGTNPAFYSSVTTAQLNVAVDPGSEFFWHVDAVNASGTTAGPTWSFRTAPATDCVAPSAPILSGPVSSVSGTAYQISWNSVPGSTGYVLQESADQSFGAATSTTLGATVNSLTVLRSVATTTSFYYRILARISRPGCDVSSAVSNVVVVRVEPSPSATREIRIIPVIASTPGSFGSFFRTAVQLHNASAEPSSGRIQFHVQGVSGSSDDPFVPYSLEPGQTLYIADVVAAMGQSGLGSADLVIETGAPPLVVTRIFNDAGESGTTGMNESTFRVEEAIQSGQTVVLIGPPDLSKARFNLGVRSLVDGIEFDAVVLNESGQQVGTVTRNFPSNYFLQQSAGDLLGFVIPENASILLTLRSGSGFIYGATTDNTTQDPSMQIPQPPSN